jgi:hypothetical protein
MRHRRLLLLAILLAIAALGACGTSAVGVDTCTTIEDALCKRANELGCPESDLPHSGDSLSACTRFYSIACLHGLATTATITKEQVSACVGAIEDIKTAKQCSVIEAPETTDACAWLIPPEGGADAEAGTVDASTVDGASVTFGDAASSDGGAGG